MSRKTKINDNTFLNETSREDEPLDEDTLDKAIVDLSLSLETRIVALNMYYSLKGGDKTIELLIKLGTMYEMSGTKMLHKYLFAICEKSRIEAFLKTFVAKALHGHNDKDELAYKAVDMVYRELGPEVATPYKIEFLKILMKNDSYRQKARDHLCHTINDQTIDCDYRYKAILGLECKSEPNKEENERMLWFIREGCIEFLNCSQNKTMYRILAAQYLLQSCKIDDIEREHIEHVVLNFAENKDLDYNLRADATDVLLQLTTGGTKERAQEIIMDLGRGNRTVNTIYDNAQNVHTVEIEQSVEDAIEFLHSFKVMEINNREITMEYVEKEIMDMLSEEKRDVDRIKVAINRIYMDRAIYSKYSCTLSHILLRVWTYIVGHKHEDAMRKRMLEELEEMAGTCSSGFVTRLINTISGFGDFSMRISWRDQIVSNLSGRLNARIRQMDNLGLQEKVLEQMTLATDEYSKRKHFLKFLRRNILPIREEMHTEFKEHIDDSDFDLYFRAAVSMYETGKFV